MAGNWLFEDFAPGIPITGRIESNRVFDARDPKWAREDLRDTWAFTSPDWANMVNPDVPLEERRKASAAATAAIQVQMREVASSGDAPKEECDITSHVVPGCPEEPETEVEVLVYRPKGMQKGDEGAKVIFYCLGGGLLVREPAMFPISQLCAAHDSVGVVVLFRRSWEEPFPAQINDMHAGYKWMVENADELGIDPDNVVIYGQSSGGHLATVLPFRLKRYGYSPRGVIADCAQFDDHIAPSDAVYYGGWDALMHQYTLMQYMGKNFGSPYVGPEAFANRATVEDCIGYPPIEIITAEFDPDCEAAVEFYLKVKRARSFADLHIYGGALHGVAYGGPVNDRRNTITDEAIDDFQNMDLRRPWVKNAVTGE